MDDDRLEEWVYGTPDPATEQARRELADLRQGARGIRRARYWLMLAVIGQCTTCFGAGLLVGVGVLVHAPGGHAAAVATTVAGVALLAVYTICRPLEPDNRKEHHQ